MILPGLSSAEAELRYDAWRAGRSYAPKTFEVGPSGRDEGRDLLEQVKTVATEFLANYEPRREAQAQAEFDAEFSVKLHTILKIPSYIIASDDFWRYLACEELWELVVWRHGKDEEGEVTVGKANFGLGGDAGDIFPKRLWMRGEVAHDNGLDDPYELAARGGQDFWMSGIMKPLYANNHSFARALIRFQFPEAGVFRGRQYRPQTLSTNEIRELYKRLKHFYNFVDFSTLDSAAATELIESVAEDL